MSYLEQLFSAWGISKGSALYEFAKLNLGKDLSTMADNDVACAEVVSYIIQDLFISYVPITTSTFALYKYLQTNRHFKKVDVPLPGDIVISPTGVKGGQNGILHGHVGIVGKNGVVMSNNSETGLFDTHLTLAYWRSYYVVRGGYIMEFYRLT